MALSHYPLFICSSNHEERRVYGDPKQKVRTVLTGIVIPFPFVVKCYESDGDSGVRQCSACE